MTQTQTSSGTTLWSQMVEQQLNETDVHEANCRENRDEQPPIHLDEAARDRTTENNPGDSSLQDSATATKKDSQLNQNEINNLVAKVQDLKNMLQENKILLAQEKDKRLAAEKEFELKFNQFEHMESLLKEEYHRRIVIEKKLKWSLRKVDELRHGSNAPEYNRKNKATPAMGRYELENVEKQLQEKTSSNIELASKVKEQKDIIDSLEWRVAELTLQMKSASDTINHQSDKTADEATSSAAEKHTEMKSVSSQTQAFLLKEDPETKEMSTQMETLVSEDVSELMTISTQTEDPAAEDVSDLREASIDQPEVAGIPEQEKTEEIPPKPEEVVTSGPDPKEYKKPSLWRRLKKLLTPACRRQYKSRRQNQSLQVTPATPNESGCQD